MNQLNKSKTAATVGNRRVTVKRATANRSGAQRLGRALLALAQAQMEAEAEATHKQTKVPRKRGGS
jgi:hypothetical protein